MPHSDLEHLRTLVEASKLINSSIDPDDLLPAILGVAQKELGVERGTLYFVDERKGEIWSRVAGELGSVIRLPIGKGIAGSVAATGEHVLLHDAYADERFDSSQDHASGFRTRSMLCTPIKNRSGRVVGVLQLLNKTDGAFGRVDLDFLDAISDHMAIAMENATMHVAMLEKERMQKELQLGRDIQSTLLPSPPVDVFGTTLAAQSLSCFEVGGDYYDFLELPEGELAIAIGDVSGKGVGAALIMSSLQAALRVAAPLERDLAMLARRLNALLYRATRGKKYVTFFIGRYSPRTGELRYVNAGHNAPMLVSDGNIEGLHSTGRPVGIFPESSWNEATVVLDPGDTLMLYTDGLNEAANADDEELGNARLAQLFLETSQLDPHAIPPTVIQRVTEFEGGAPPNDDKTIVVLRRNAVAS